MSFIIIGTAEVDPLALKIDSNLSDLASAPTSRTNLGLGTMAEATATDYLAKAGNLSGLADAPTARTNLGLGTMATQSSATYATVASPSLTGTPLSTTSSINTNTTQIATTAFVRDMLSDCTWSVPPIVSTTTATSGTGAAYVNAAPDYGYLQGANVNLAGYCQKYLLVFARSNSGYGFNFLKEYRVACKMAANWTASYTGVTYNLFFRINSGTGTGSLAQIGFGISIDMPTKVLTIQAHDGTTLTTKATSYVVPNFGISSVDFMVKSDGTGTVYAYADGVLIDSTTGMSTGNTFSIFTSALNVVEVTTAGTSSSGNPTVYVSNLRSFIAHG